MDGIKDVGMKIVWNNIIPFGGFSAMTVWPFVFVRRRANISAVMLRHETTHALQQKELLLVGFYILYILCMAVELIRCGVDKSRGTRADGRHRTLWNRAYRMIIFEREAFANQYDEHYNVRRKPFACFRS